MSRSQRTSMEMKHAHRKAATHSTSSILFTCASTKADLLRVDSSLHPCVSACALIGGGQPWRSQSGNGQSRFLTVPMRHAEAGAILGQRGMCCIGRLPTFHSQTASS
jgi:hypothetical protein